MSINASSLRKLAVIVFVVTGMLLLIGSGQCPVP